MLATLLTLQSSKTTRYEQGINKRRQQMETISDKMRLIKQGECRCGNFMLYGYAGTSAGPSRRTQSPARCLSATRWHRSIRCLFWRSDRIRRAGLSSVTWRRRAGAGFPVARQPRGPNCVSPWRSRGAEGHLGPWAPPSLAGTPTEQGCWGGGPLHSWAASLCRDWLRAPGPV